MSNHTQGPWRAQSPRVYGSVKWDTIVVNKDGDPVASCNFAGYSPGTAHANAHLIASAPTLKAENEVLRALNAEMVEALKNLLMTIRNWVEDEIGDDDDGWEAYARLRPFISRAKAVIAKTEGKDTT